ncbi:conserved hypothetical membrane protein [Azoarcus olearius]|uniref:Conserved hypothetical membrane protein n=2 Tax=Azoarcus sp. (strain BH72) TaxID=418699 RepID=A1K7K6_AZOSB|nr:conserved hypothetical membrane protein [Azoarcus olearius]
MTDSTPGATAAHRLRRYARPAMWGAGALAAVAVLGFGAVPPVLRHYTVQILHDKLGREVAVEGARFNPFTLTAELRGVRIMEADGSAEALAADLVRANLELESVVRRAPVLHELAVVAPRVQFVRRADGGSNWSDVVERLAAEPPSEEPARFSLGNISLSDGRIVVEDAAHGLRHDITELRLGVPFVSNLPVKVDVFVEPTLSGRVNGDPLALSGRTKPFSDDRETVAELTLKNFELSPWLAYLPFKPKFTVPSGTLSTSIQLSFSQPEGQQPLIALQGQIDIAGLAVQEVGGQPVFAVEELGLELGDVQPLAGKWHFSRLRVIKPEVDLVRLTTGGLNVTALLPESAASAPADKTAKKGARPAAAEGSTAGSEVDFLLASARVRDGIVRFEDRSLGVPFKARVEAVNLDMRDLATSGDMPAEIRLDYVTDGGEKFSHQDNLRLKPFELDGGVVIEQFQPARYSAYLAQALPGGEVRDGRLDGGVRYHVSGAGDAFDAEVTAENLSLRDFVLALKGRKETALKVPELLVSQGVMRLKEQRVDIGEVTINRAALAATRLRDGSLDLQTLVASGEPARKTTSPTWSVGVQKLALSDASLRLEDRMQAKPVTLAVDGLSVKADNLSTAKGANARLSVGARINRAGRLGIEGSLALEPLKGNLELDLRDIDLLPLQPYALEETKIAITRGTLSGHGTVAFEQRRTGGIAGGFKGDVGVGDFAAVDKLNAADLARWRALQVSDIEVDFDPFALSIGRVALSDFFSRLILDQQGRLNLREIRGGAAEEAAAQANVQQQGNETTAIVPPPRPSPPIRVGRVELKGGNIAFSDRFVRPNYDANLTGLAGTLSGLSSDPSTVAKLNLAGKVDNAAPVQVQGELNPFRQDRYLDIAASVRDFELTGVSSYAGKYVGYGIQKGKLSADLSYKIRDRQLTATNRVFIDQLTFGDRVDSPSATDLPVQLAVSLLKNGRGEIDLSLPVSGTLDDPQFSVFGLVVRALVNLVGKAVTAPFALLGGAFGGEEMSRVDFAAGVARPEGEALDKLAALAKALNDRPALRLDITPFADPATDVEGLKRAMLERQVAALKLRALVAKGQAAPSVEEVQVGAEEYPALLRQVYRDGDFKKPRNVIGLVKDVPVAEMEALIFANTKVGEDELRALAVQRGQTVKNWLLGSGGVSPERVFLLAPRVGGAGAETAGRVEFALR